MGVSICQIGILICGTVELETNELANEAKVGFEFHYLVGGGMVALAYPAWFVITGISVPENHVFPGLIFGLISVGLTWFVQYLCFGFGFFGKNALKSASTTFSSLLLHSLYGLSMGLVLQILMMVS